MKRLWCSVLIAALLFTACSGAPGQPQPEAPPPVDAAALTTVSRRILAAFVSRQETPRLLEEAAACAESLSVLAARGDEGAGAMAEVMELVAAPVRPGSFAAGSRRLEELSDLLPPLTPEESPVLALAAREMSARWAAEREAGLLALTAAGDTTFGEYPEVPVEISFHTEFERRGRDLGFPLRLVSPFFRADALTILNCEGTFTDSEDMAQKTYRFKGPREYAEMFVRGDVELVNLANNHTYDYKEQGYADTREALRYYGVGCWGDGEEFLTQADGGVVGCLGYNLFNIEPDLSHTLAGDIAGLREKGADVVVVNFHWGLEYSPYANDYQQRTARQAVDAGADLVIGHHPHVLQGIERYKGVTILYSLGNFAFGGDEELKDRDTMLVRQTFRPVEGGGFEPDKLLLQPCYISTAEGYNNYSPPPVFGREAERIAQKVVERSAHLAHGVTREDFILLDQEEDTK